MSYFFPALGAAVALAGGDKLTGVRGYKEMFRRLGWPESGMQVAAAAELAGGLLMMPRATRPLGGALVAATSAAVLATEVGHGDANLALPRSVIMLLAFAAVADALLPRRT